MDASRLNIALLYNLKKNAPRHPGQAPDAWADLDSESTIQALTTAIESAGHRVYPMEGDIGICARLQSLPPDLAFNICEGHSGASRESQVPAILEMLQIPYTGSKILTLALTLDKAMCKRLLAYHGLPTTPFQEFTEVDTPLKPGLTFPLFVKPNAEGTGMGVTIDSVVRNEAELRRQLHYCLEAYEGNALVERYLSGREFTVGMLGNGNNLHVFPVLELDLSPIPEAQGLYTSHIKSYLYDKPNYLCPAPISSEFATRLKDLAVQAFKVTGCLDMARVDFRLDGDDQEHPYILEVNPLPGLSPGVSDLVMEAEADGIGHTELVLRIIETALKRYNLA